MHCAEFDQRVNARLDARLSIDDVMLSKHADQCPECAALLDGYRSLEYAIERIPAQRPLRRPGDRAVDVLVGERAVARRFIGAAAVAAVIAGAAALPINFARNPASAPTASAHAHAAQALASSRIASPHETLRAAGESWWALMRESTQPLTTAPELLPRPDLAAIAEALKYQPARLGGLSWSQIEFPFSATTSGATQIFHMLPTFRKLSDSSG